MYLKDGKSCSSPIEILLFSSEVAKAGSIQKQKKLTYSSRIVASLRCSEIRIPQLITGGHTYHELTRTH